MNSHMALESYSEEEIKDKFSKLINDDILYSAEYSSDTNKVTPIPYKFRGYVSSPDEGIWAKLAECYFDDNGEIQPVLITNKSGANNEKIIVNNIETGLFLTKKEALIALKDFIETVYNAAVEAVNNIE